MTVTFFALFGFIFLITQYFQFVRGYGTLSTGARILPVALSIAVASVVGAHAGPADRHQGRGDAAGLLLFGASFVWISTVAVDASYATVIVPQMVLMGLGMGLITTPATESILLVLPPARAGVGSAVNDATRELGGTLGVAVVGSLFSSVFASHLADGAFGRLPAAVLTQAQDSVGAALTMTGRDPGPLPALQDAFMTGLRVSCMVVGLLCLVGAVGALGVPPWPGAGPSLGPTRSSVTRSPCWPPEPLGSGACRSAPSSCSSPMPSDVDWWATSCPGSRPRA